jgi:transglutaminase superfamily protein
MKATRAAAAGTGRPRRRFAAPLDRAAEPRPLARWRKAALVGEILVAYVHVRRTLRSKDIRSAVSDLRVPAAGRDAASDPAAYGAGLRLGRAVTRVLPLLPGADSRCLMRSLVLCGVLARRGVSSSVVIGVRPGTRFGAHAWVELRGHPLLPPQEGEFQRLVAL